MCVRLACFAPDSAIATGALEPAHHANLSPTMRREMLHPASPRHSPYVLFPEKLQLATRGSKLLPSGGRGSPVSVLSMSTGMTSDDAP